MTKLFGELSKATSIGMQFMKEKTGFAKVENNPIYEEALIHFEELNSRYSEFYADIKSIIEFLGQSTKSGVEMSEKIFETNEKMGNSENQFFTQLKLFFINNNNNNQEKIINIIEKQILENIQNVLNQLNHLGQIKNKRRKHQLLCDSLKNEMESIIKTGNAEKLTKTTILYEQTKDKMNNETNEFIQKISFLWNGKIIVFELALNQLIGLIYNFTQESLNNLNNLIPPNNYYYPQQQQPQQQQFFQYFQPPQ